MTVNAHACVTPGHSNAMDSERTRRPPLLGGTMSMEAGPWSSLQTGGIVPEP